MEAVLNISNKQKNTHILL